MTRKPYETGGYTAKITPAAVLQRVRDELNRRVQARKHAGDKRGGKLSQLLREAINIYLAISEDQLLALQEIADTKGTTLEREVSEAVSFHISKFS